MKELVEAFGFRWIKGEVEFVHTKLTNYDMDIRDW